MSSSKGTKLLSYIIVLLMLSLYLFPLFYLFNVSMKTQSEYLIDPVAIAKSLRLENFMDAWEKGNFSQYMWNSILYTGVSTLLTLVISVFAAFPLARGYVKFSTFFYVFFLISMYLPNPLIPQFALINSLGLYNTQLGFILLKTTGTGIAFLMFVGYIKSVSRELDEAAAMDGCGYSRYLFTILVPLMKPVLATGIILTAIGAWNDIIGPTIYLSDPAYQPVTKGLFSFYGQYMNNWPLLACGILIVTLPLVILYIFLQRFIVGGAMAGAVKS
ncbi:carbohydrate ABC transporter permease [Paenibacillus peoriae]|uniref:carbohydrate ABC transporter permease n=1 Tax=Paenibacillus peoriae TaxID=59893 RepID=UPI00026C648F|nr:carbohydrate ABC transporter permease [Paenibacillus peoriae]MEC0182526.1 carbohydrate ABC transporter permease [Paenibacillus peoriae]